MLFSRLKCIVAAAREKKRSLSSIWRREEEQPLPTSKVCSGGRSPRGANLVTDWIAPSSFDCVLAKVFEGVSRLPLLSYVCASCASCPSTTSCDDKAAGLPHEAHVNKPTVLVPLFTVVDVKYLVHAVLTVAADRRVKLGRGRICRWLCRMRRSRLQVASYLRHFRSRGRQLANWFVTVQNSAQSRGQHGDILTLPCCLTVRTAIVCCSFCPTAISE